MSKRDYYEILGLAKNSTAEEIKRAYRQLASKYHPDKISGKDGSSEKTHAEEHFKEVKEAYETLSDVEKRAQYDMYGHAAQHHHGPTPGATSAQFDEMFRSFFSQTSQSNENIFGHHSRQQVIHIVNISLSEAYTGRTIILDNVTYTLPPGIRSGTKIFSNNKFYRIDVQQHYKFKRSNDDLLVDTTITSIEAALGVEAVLDHLDNNALHFNIPPGIQPGQIVKLSNKGMKNPETNKAGDMLVRISISIPRTLTDAEKIALKSVSHRVSVNI